MTTLAMCIALAVIFHMIESQIPFPSPIPGYHFGLANIPVFDSFKEAERP